MSSEEQSVLELFQRFRRDRRVLLNFILSGNLIKKVAMPPGATSLEDVDLDHVSVDFVLSCAKKGELLELSEAIRVQCESFDYPPLDNAGPVQEFFLSTVPESSGPAPSRPPPPVPAVPRPSLSSPSPSLAKTSSSSQRIETTRSSIPSNGTHLSKSVSVESDNDRELTVDDIEDFDDDDEDEEGGVLRMPRWQRNDASDLLLGLPPFATGLIDDDLRQTAYEILVASAGAAGGLIVPSKEKKKEKKSRLLRKLARSRTDTVVEKPAHGLVGLLETMRIQLEISETMDIRTRQGMLNALVGKVGKRMDSLLVPLELLSSVSRTEFSDMKAFLRWQKRQLNLLEEGLINHPAVGFGESARSANDLRLILRKIEESESLPSPAGEIQRAECIRSLRDVTTALAERPSRGDLTGNVCHWADGYHLNVMIYEKMLLTVFDILDEGKLTGEVDEILEFLRSTWRILGINETIHDASYSWVLFRQFVITSERKMLLATIQQLRRIPTKEQRGPQERLHLKSLCSKVKTDDGTHELTFLQAFLLPIQKWTEKKLRDYHHHFSEGTTLMTDILSVAVIVRRLVAEESEQMMQSVYLFEREQIEGYILTSTKSAFSRVLSAAEARAVQEHLLTCLAEDCIKLLRKDVGMFLPIFSERYPQAPVVSASTIHKLYGNKLKPFLDSIEHLTEDVVSVLPAAVTLEHYVMSLIASACEEELVEDYCVEKLTPYQVESISGTLVMRWVNAQQGRISSWVERSIQQERWDPISPQQRHGSSIVEVYRIIEETVNQFFDLKVPMRVGELNGLLRVFDNILKEYTQQVMVQIVSKDELVPPIPVLTRYKKESGIKALVRKETPVYQLPDERKSGQINLLSTPVLCVRMNTLHYAVSHLSKLEDNIQQRWMAKERAALVKSKIVVSPSQKSRSPLEGSRKDMNAAIDRICEFMGTKIIFWDMRETFIEELYRDGVSRSRLDSVIDVLDAELNKVCEFIAGPLRDRTVTGLLQASVDGLVRVLLDGGPCRVFSPDDAKLLEDDLDALKEFFVAGGDGLPRGTVENLVSRVRPIISLHGYETRALLEDLRGVGQGGGRSRLGADSETLIRILCHRSDSEASLYLKKQYKIPTSTA